MRISDWSSDVCSSDLAHVAFGAQQTTDLGVVAVGSHIVDVLGGDAVLLGIDHGVQRPAHDVAPLIVTLAHKRPQRLLGDDLRQDDEVLDRKSVVKGKGVSVSVERGGRRNIKNKQDTK